MRFPPLFLAEALPHLFYIAVTVSTSLTEQEPEQRPAPLFHFIDREQQLADNHFFFLRGAETHSDISARQPGNYSTASTDSEAKRGGLSKQIPSRNIYFVTPSREQQNRARDFTCKHRNGAPRGHRCPIFTLASTENARTKYVHFHTCKHRKCVPTGTQFHTCKHRICTPNGSTKSRLTRDALEPFLSKSLPRSSQQRTTGTPEQFRGAHTLERVPQLIRTEHHTERQRTLSTRVETTVYQLIL